ncbi:MAG: tellurite resistance TerB family protein [Silicimonas sp.]|nr:tellurite resistance TerB family protein [Silicimonas sp.]
MSFVKTLATLAAGFAAAKGHSKFQQMGGMAGVKDALQGNEQINQMSDQAFGMMEKMGLPTDQLKSMRDQFLGGGGDAASMAGMSGLMAALGGGLAGGAEQSSAMIDAMTGTTAATDAMEENAKLMIRAMIQAARADGEIDAEERAVILDKLGDLDASEQAFIEEAMDAPVDAMALAQDTSQQLAAQVYATALMTVRVDSLAEATYLNDLARGLGLSEDTLDRIHKTMGVS